MNNIREFFNFAATDILKGETARQIIAGIFCLYNKYTVSVPLCGMLMRPQPLRC